MATITNAVVRMGSSGQVLRSDCFGNNAATECPRCLAYPILLIARMHHRGASAENPGICRHCGCRVHIVDDVNQEHLDIVNVEIQDD
jgi:hypothetical protein